MANTVAVGAVIGMLGLPMEPLIGILKKTLKKKDEETLEINRSCCQVLGYEYTKTTCIRCAFNLAPHV